MSHLILIPLNNSFELKIIALADNEKVKIGRQTNQRTLPKQSNGYFDSKVLSRQHAEIWSANNKIYIKDVKSSNGTFLNNERLSPEGVESSSVELENNNLLEFGIDIIGDDNKSIIHRKVSSKCMISHNQQEFLNLKQELNKFDSNKSYNLNKCFDNLEKEIKESRELGAGLSGISNHFSQIKDTLNGQLPVEIPQIDTNNVDVSNIQQHLSKFNQRLQQQQEFYQQLLADHSSLKSKLQEKDDQQPPQRDIHEGEDNSDASSIMTTKPDDKPDYEELIQQNQSLASRITTLSDELSVLQQQSTLFNDKIAQVEGNQKNWQTVYDNALKSNKQSQKEDLESAINIFRREQEQQSKRIDSLQKKTEKSLKDDKSLKFAGIISIFILGLAAITVFRGNQN
ncbi:SMAD/FHA domain-containing protein [Wallemia mellicola]|uniref:SMAD/FHA domain-containing protein n=1 Tax=Wallemia mellicola TaxID=1708541 RepID=A0A4T0PUL5_9BASI|nr:hypothetical protein E3Q23_01186 [Wallemia mellicola]TIB81012.1 SMAD/FHA domain-containing protein [Wallemia mellicola]TIC13234.1 SMAD/FHA domain-containing protein [Wallemia mellicola]TIC14861.1 SMAD/FHA domain-containing protein [Wallemia mellicola]TIC58313.1 SMAD/FHA domain-containing protein [Wallemia mellicola]